MRFSVGNDTAGKPSWWLYANNGEMVAWAGEIFGSAFNAQRACLAFRVDASSARFDLYADGGGKWRWRAWRSGDKVASSGESFFDKSTAQRPADNVRLNAGSATGP